MEVANRDSEVRLGTSLYQTFASIQWGQGTVDQNEDGAPAISVGGVLSMGCKKSNQERTQAQLTAESREVSSVGPPRPRYVVIRDGDRDLL